MAQQTKKKPADEDAEGPSGLDDLRQELNRYLSGATQGWIDKAGDVITDLTDRLHDMAEGEGGLAEAGSRVLRGENPVKALMSQKVKDTKDSVVGKVKDTFSGGGGGGKGKGSTIKATNIVEFLDVGVPVRTAYDHWTQFEEFSSFTKGVRSVSQNDETESDWNVKVGPSSRSWKATIQEQVPDERIVWTSEGAKGSTHGAVSFHELGPNLTRILVVVEYFPAGFFEKTGNLWRAQGRRLRLDLKHFGRYVTLGVEEEVEGWRGEIRDGEVVRTHEEGLEDDEREDDEYEEEDEDEDEDGEDAQEEDDWDEDEEVEDEDEDENERDDV
ncbi:SRPBCC family protein [Actinacidiphila rubida]|uniref:Polyketide cyclase / dehydrase and lipid transport n=1 Tax=Actinacidiphila rubida TaxID=310780 RepID=A0A1H8TJ37_9ACTN|nr:SRPBCC family protein [Actinacidiphila rubida]SEO90982.1 Polyketide cyclase / dehydrase and lipid transport [Actinacidiphila rubida]